MFEPLSPKQALEGRKRVIVSNNNTLWLVIDSSDAGLAQFYQFTDFLKRYWAIEENLFMSIQIALSEAVMNAIRHGNASDENKSVYIGAINNSGFYSFSVEDEGPGFDYVEAENPLLQHSPLEEGGRGVIIMRHMTDDVHFTNEGKCVTLSFRKGQENIAS